MLAQIGVDLLSCLVIARLAALWRAPRKTPCEQTRVFHGALARRFVSFHGELYGSATDRSLRCFVDGAGMLRSSDCSKESAETGFFLEEYPPRSAEERGIHRFGRRINCRLGTLFRPETPILLIAAVIVFGGLFLPRVNYRRWLWVCLVMTLDA